MKRPLFSRDLLSLFGKGEDAPAPAPEQRRDEMEEDHALALSLSFGIGRKTDKVPRSSSAAALPTPAEMPAPLPLPALPRASSVPVQADEHAPRLSAAATESPSSVSLQGYGQRLQGIFMSTSSLPAVIDAAGNDESNKRKEAQSLKRLEVKNKMIGKRNSTCSSNPSKEAPQVPEVTIAYPGNLASRDEAVVVANNENQSSGKDLAQLKPRRGRPPKYQLTLPSQHSLSAAAMMPNPAFRAVTMEPSSSFVPFSSQAILRRVVSAGIPLPPSSLAPRALFGSSSRGDQTILGRAPAARANGSWDAVGMRLMQEMPAVYTKDLCNGKRVNGFLYKYRRAEGVKIVCVCHGSFFTPSEFVQHAGAGNEEIVTPLRHIVVSPPPTRQ